MSSASEARAFTRTELLLVLAMWCVLLPVLTVASQRSEEDGNRLQCRNSLRQIGAWLTMYAEDHDDALPRNSGGFWAWDIERSVVDSALNYGVSPDAFFCPHNTSGIYSAAFSNTPQRIIGGYVLMIRDTPMLAYSNLNTSIVPQPVQVAPGEIYTPKAEERELAADVILSYGRSKTTASFTDIVGPTGAPTRSAHIEDFRPAGSNILYLDGHVEWRDFNEMTVRTGSSFPSFWY